LTVLHFNARSICTKLNEIIAELSFLFIDVIFITETWLSPQHALGHYNMPGFNAYHNYRADKVDGGASIYVRESFISAQLSVNVTSNCAFNVCAAVLGQS
jgi:hypothetical protein